MAFVTLPKLEPKPRGGWRARKVIPADVRDVFGKREAKASWAASLGYGEAQRRFLQWHSDLAAKIEAARAGQISLSDDEVNEIAARWYRRRKPELLGEGETAGGYDGALAALHDPGSETVKGLMRSIALEELRRDETPANEGSIERLAARLLYLHQSLYGLAKQRTEGDYTPDAMEPLLPPPQPAKRLSGPRALALFEQWAKHPEQRDANAPSTIKRYRGVFKPFAAYLGNPPAASVTADDVARYFEHRIGEGLKPLTARNVHKAALSSVFGWAQGKRLVSSNPVTGFRIKARAKARVRDKSFTDDEAATILRAARAVEITPDDRFRLAARRWVPVLCAYTGARVQEMTQLRKADVVRHKAGFWFLRLSGEAGTIKDRDTRDVPLHPNVVKEGFVDFAQAASDGPLFFDPKTRRRDDAETSLGESRARELARWVRTDVGVSDANVAPNHAWRHRFKTAATLAGIEGRYADAMTGHAPRTEGERYGERLVEVLHREVRKIKQEWIEGAK